MKFSITKKYNIILFLLIGCSLPFLCFRFFVRSNKHITPPKPFSFNMPIDHIKKIILKNGMQILMFQNKMQPKVRIQIAYDIGSSVEKSGEYGLAHLIEHMIFKGTKKLSETDITTIARKFGATFNAFTSRDMTSYYFEVNKNNWKPFVEILADCMQNARFDKEHLASELKTVIQELRMNRDDYDRLIFNTALQLLFHSNHPYHMPIIGFKENLLALTSEDLKKFYNKYYQPNHATLFVVGDINFDEVEQVTKKYFEPIQKSPSAQEISVIFPEEDDDIITHHTTIFEDVQNETIAFFWRIPGIKRDISHIVDTIIDILSNGEMGRIHHSLVDKHKIATSVTISAPPLMSDSIFLIIVQPLPGKQEDCQQRIIKELEKIIKNGIKEEDLTAISRNEIRAFFETMQDISDFTSQWLFHYFSTRDEVAIFNYVNKFAHLKTADIQSFIATYLDPFLVNRIDILPIPENKKPLKEKRKEISDAMDQEILAKHQRKSPLENPSFLNQTPMPALVDFSFPKPTKILHLPNGLKVILKQEKSIPLIALTCLFKDAYYFKDAKEGIGISIMMDMFMESSEDFSKKELVNFFKTYGTAYSFSDHGITMLTLNQDFSKVQERLFHILIKPTFHKKELEKVKQIYIDGFQRSKNTPGDMAYRLLRNEIFKDHPFAWTYDEGIDITKKITPTDLFALYKTHVNPANMVMSIVGDFDLKDMEALVTKVWASWPAAPRKIIEKSTSSFQSGKIIKHHMIRDQVILAMGSPSTVTIYDPDLIPLLMLNIICLSSLGSRLYTIREQTGLFYSASGSFATDASKIPGYNIMAAVVSLDTLSVAQEALKNVMRDALKTPVSKKELNAAKQIYLNNRLSLASTTSAIGVLLCFLDALDLGFDFYDREWQQVQTMTAEDITKAAKKHINIDDLTTVCVGPVNN